MSQDKKLNLSNRKRALLRKLQQQQGLNTEATQPIPQRKTEEKTVLSSAQEWMWLLEQLSPSVYNNPLTFKLTGQLNHRALEKAINEIVNRHEALRTKFPLTDGKPQPFINPLSHYSLLMVEVASEIEAKESAIAHTKHPFNLEKEFPWRAILFRLSNTEHWLHLTIHHIVDDDRSRFIWLEELTKLYEAFCENRPSPLAELPIQYGDFALWQRSQLQGENYQQLLNYWQQQLADLPPALNLPYDRALAIQNSLSEQVPIQISPKLASSLKSVSQQEQVTLFTLLLTALNILLYRYTGQRDLIIGTPTSLRKKSETQGLIGVFINNLVLRNFVERKVIIREFLKQVQTTALKAQQHNDFPYINLVNQLQVGSIQKRNPLFQVMLDFQSESLPVSKLLDLGWELLEINPRTAKVPLTLHLEEDGKKLKGFWVYDKNLFAQSTIQYMSECFGNLLQNLVVDPNQSIETISVLDPDPVFVHRALPQPRTPHPSFREFPQTEIEQSIPSRFEAQVRAYGEEIAIKTQRYQWTYQELNQQANRIARTIINCRGTEPERIALLFEHDAPMIAGLLAALKAGKTYVPLDPQYPVERLQYMLKDSQADVILTNNQNLTLSQQLVKKTTTIINADSLPSSVSEEDLNLSISPDTVAYLLYTSGSTGQPKGVIQNHCNVLHYIRYQTNQLQITPADGLTLLSSYSFDAAIVDIFSALLNGATLYPIDIKQEGVTGLWQWLEDELITIYHSTPTLYRFLIKEFLSESRAFKEKLSKIRAVVLGGEEILPQDINSFQEHFASDCIFVNLFGSSESTISLQKIITQEWEKESQFVSIGFPIDEKEVFLINESGEETQIYGEIAIRSPYLALGYWQKPELTQSVFLSDADGGDRRIYRTGDLGRLRADGTVEFLGRKDFQIKLRGFRIELGEIEYILSQYEGIQEAVVIAKTQESGDKYLVAYYIPSELSSVSPQQLREFLQQKLPDYMIPSAFVSLNKFPLTPNGKRDRAALPDPNFSDRAVEFIPPSTEIEKTIANIWSQVLSINEIGIQDNFFHLGGHSLLATQVVSRLRQTFRVEISLIQLFEAPTIAKLAKEIENSTQTLTEDYEEGEI